MVDLLIKDGFLLTLEGGIRRGKGVGLNTIEGGDVAIKDGLIVDVGKNLTPESGEEINAEGKVVMPGFIDAHTHALFGGSRVDEFELKTGGATYEEIMKEGGGILHTVNRTREMSREEMKDVLGKNLRKMYRTGTTTVEVKSGYGLNCNTEIEMLRAMNEFDEEWIDLIPTYMGAHEFPPEKGREEYIEEIMDRQIPEVAENSLSDFCDIFCEKGVYSRDESEKILKRAKEFNLSAKIHADELTDSGGAELAGDVGAISAEHLIHPSDEGLRRMAESDVIGVMLPGTSFVLDQDKPPIDKFRENGIPLALGSDFNPGSSPIYSMSLVTSFACYHYGMRVEEALAGATINAAHALGKGESTGSIEKGKKADIVITEYSDYREIPYWFNENPVKLMVKSGRISFETRYN